MAELFEGLAKYEAVIDIVSCVFTVLALVFSLYLWLLDHLSEDEYKFIEGKEEFVESLNKCLKTIDGSQDSQDNEDRDIQDARSPLKDLLENLEEVNSKLEVILNYRFWARSKRKEEYNKISRFHFDTRYLISTLRRSMEPNIRYSLLNMPELKQEEIDDIKVDYKKGLYYIIDFLEHWS